MKEPDPNKPHFYINNLPEAVSPAFRDKLIASGQGRDATVKDIQKHGLTAGPGMVKVIIFAPNPACRFKAVPRMEDGFASWVNKMKHMAESNPALNSALMAGDCKGFASALRSKGYFTGDASIYAGGMEAHKRALTKKLEAS